jgi:hypothetical protein
MMAELTSHGSELLAQLEAGQETYQPSPDIQAYLGSVTLDAYLGPFRSGKSTIISAMAETYADEGFARAPTLTTREPAERDKGNSVRYINHTDEGIAAFADRVQKGDIVQYIIHPTTGRIYATDIESYAHPHNMLELLPGSVSDMERLGFKQCNLVYVVNRCDQVCTRIQKDYPLVNEERIQRIREGHENLEWALDQPVGRLLWAYNYPYDLPRTVKAIHDYLTSDPSVSYSDGPQLVKDTMRAFETLEPFVTTIERNSLIDIQ